MLASPTFVLYCDLYEWSSVPQFFPCCYELCSGVICSVWLPGKVAATWAVFPQEFSTDHLLLEELADGGANSQALGDRLLLPWDKKPPSPCSWRRAAQAGSSFSAAEILQSQLCFGGKCRGFASHLPHSPLAVIFAPLRNEEQNAPLRKWGMLSLQQLSISLPGCKRWHWGHSSDSEGTAITCCVTLNRHSKLLKTQVSCLEYKSKYESKTTLIFTV